jgi:hypothetical protein
MKHFYNPLIKAEKVITFQFAVNYKAQGIKMYEVTVSLFFKAFITTAFLYKIVKSINISASNFFTVLTMKMWGLNNGKKQNKSKFVPVVVKHHIMKVYGSVQV